MDEPETTRPKRQPKTGIKGIIMIIILISVTVVLIATSLFFFTEATKEDVPVLSVTIKVSDGKFDPVFDRWDTNTNTYLPYIENITTDVVLTQNTVSMLEAPGDTPLKLPGIVINVREVGSAKLISHWTSVLYTGPGDYNLTISFKEPPETGDSMKILFEIDDIKGDDIFPLYNDDTKNSSIFYVWE